MNGSAIGGGRRGEIAHRIRNIFVARGEVNHLRYLIESRNIYRRLARRTREAADQASLRSSEASVTLSLSEIRAYEAELDALRQTDTAGGPLGRRLSLFGCVWSSSRRRQAEAAIAARNLAVEAAREAARQAETLHRATREYEEEAAFVAGNVARAEEALQPWSGRYSPERALAVHESAMLSAIAQTSDEDLEQALRYGDLTSSQYRELMALSGRDDVVRRIDAGDFPVPSSLPFETCQDGFETSAYVEAPLEEGDQPLQVLSPPDVMHDERGMSGGDATAGEAPGRSLLQDNEEAFEIAVEQDEPAKPAPAA